MRKFLSLILAFLIISSLAIAPVWADDEEGDGYIDPYKAPLQAPKATIIEGKASNYKKTSTRLEGFVAGGYIGFEGINFDRQPNKLDYHVGLSSNLRTDLEVRIDSPTGRLIAKTGVKISDWSKGKTYTIDITEKVSGVHDVYFITTNSTIHFYKFQFYTDEVIEFTSPNLTYNETIRYPDIVDNPYYNDIITALDLEFITEYETAEFKPQLPITRYEFAKTVSDIMKLSPAKESYFSDVTAETPNSAAINAVRENAYLKGVTETEFAPYDFVTALNATVVAVRMLGYEHMAALKGGYPVGYKLVANELNILSGLADNEVLRRDTFARWIVDVINASYSDINSIKNGTVQYDNVNGLLSKTHKIFKGTGIVTANQFGSIYTALGETVKNFVDIDGVSYYCENTYSPAFLGMKCDYYYMERNGRNEIISIVPSAYGKIKEIDGKVMETLDSTSVSYYTDETKTKVTKLKTDTKTVFLINGKAIDTSIKNLVSASDFKGQILWIDNNNKGVADVVSIWIPETYELNTVSQTKLADKLDSSSNKKLTSQKDTNIADADIIYYLNGEEYIEGEKVKVSDIPVGSIVQVYESKNTNGKKLIRIYSMDAPITGTITEISKDYVYIGGIPYKTDVEVKLNDSGSFYVDKYDHIVYYKEGAKEADRFGLFIAAATGSVGAFGDQKLEIKLYSKEASISIFEVSEKAIIDGKKLNGISFTFDDALNGIGEYKGLVKAPLNSPVRFRLNAENKITFIDTLLEGAKDENDTMKAIKSGDFYYRLNARMFTTSSKIAYDYPANIDNNAIFRMYADADGTDTADYSATTISDLFKSQNTSIKSITLYSSKGDFMTDIVVQNNRAKIGAYKQALVVTSKFMGVDKAGEPAIRITGIMNNGQAKTYIINTAAYEKKTEEKAPDGSVTYKDSLLKAVIDNIKVGDIIRPSFELKSEMAGLELIFSNDAKADNGAGIVPKLYKDGDKKSAFYPENSSHGKQDIFGIVAERINGFTKINRVGSAEDKPNYEYLLTAGKNAIIYDCATHDYKKGTEADLEVGDYVVISLNNMIVDSIVIYRNHNFN